ncbi:MAG: type II toxin-antitoxin system HicB family antitoxin [Oscillospiraceae bacterium]|nr:type II toxin-antitoxin system HicB family antitoxin [Oscillospiraceae bacterium]
MKTAYPVIFTPASEGYVAYVPDFNCNTQGTTLAEAIIMARDVIGLMGIDMEDDGLPLPAPSSPADVQHGSEDILSMVDIDFTEYRRRNAVQSVRRNVSLPAWLDYEAQRAGLNVSAVLQEALKTRLGMSAR